MKQLDFQISTAVLNNFSVSSIIASVVQLFESALVTTSLIAKKICGVLLLGQVK